MPKFSSRRLVHHAAAQMFDLVADVERYPEFVPLCQSLRIRQRNAQPDGREVVIADMTVSFKLVKETFTSRVTLDRAICRYWWNICRGRSAVWKIAGRLPQNPNRPARSAFTLPTSSRAGCWLC